MKKIHFPKTRFSELAARDGGVTRMAAVAAALQSIESSRGESDTVIENSIAAIENIVYASDPPHLLSKQEMQTILRHGDQIVTLAGLFGYDLLDTATRSLCDLTDGMLSIGNLHIEPILVHVQAMRLMAPGSVAPSPAEVTKVLSGLQKILAHFQFDSLANINGRDTDDEVFKVG